MSSSIDAAAAAGRTVVLLATIVPNSSNPSSCPDNWTRIRLRNVSGNKTICGQFCKKGNKFLFVGNGDALDGKETARKTAQKRRKAFLADAALCAIDPTFCDCDDDDCRRRPRYGLVTAFDGIGNTLAVIVSLLAGDGNEAIPDFQLESNNYTPLHNVQQQQLVAAVQRLHASRFVPETWPQEERDGWLHALESRQLLCSTLAKCDQNMQLLDYLRRTRAAGGQLSTIVVCEDVHMHEELLRCFSDCGLKKVDVVGKRAFARLRSLDEYQLCIVVDLTQSVRRSPTRTLANI